MACQKPVDVNDDKEVNAYLNAELTRNESDYLYVFNKLEAQISMAPNRIKDARLTSFIEAVLCQLSVDYCQQVRIYVLENPQVNAHMLPNGAFIFLTGLLLRVENEPQMAYVLAHELGHFVNKHGIKKINYSKLKNNNERLQNVGTFQGLQGYSSLNAYTQQLEKDADSFAISLLNKNQYDLEQVAGLFEQMLKENKAQNKQNTGGFNSTHPGTVQRITRLKNSAVTDPPEQKVDDNHWVKIKAEYVKNWLKMELQKRDYKSSLVLLEELKANSKEPLYLDYFLGELYRKQRGRTNHLKAVAFYYSHLQASHIVNDVYKNLADAYVLLEDIENAKTYYLKYLESVPDEVSERLVRQRLKRLQ